MSEKAKKTEEEFSFKCPACKKGIMKVHKTTYDLPDKDKMLIIKFECNSCNYTKNDIIPLTTNFEPAILTLKVINKEDLRSKIYRSPTGKLENLAHPPCSSGGGTTRPSRSHTARLFWRPSPRLNSTPSITADISHITKSQVKPTRCCWSF